MELDQQTLRRVWWRGAIGAAIRGIPQGMVLGVIGAVALWGLGTLIPPLGAALGAFVFTTGGGLNLLPMIALNTVLTSIGNFLTGGKIACNAYKQEVEHQMNETRISALEAREQMRDQTIPQSRGLRTILARGPRAGQSFAHAEETREQSSDSPTLH